MARIGSPTRKPIASAAGLSTDPAMLGQIVQDGQKFSVSLTESGTGVLAPGKLIAHWKFDDGVGARCDGSEQDGDNQ